jgi:hypothetical protein
MNAYTGVGSRTAPPKVLEQITKIGEFLAKYGWLLRSGAADGADSAFERGCDQALGAKEIYLPWRDFSNSNSDLYRPSKEAFKIAESIHPIWEQLSYGAKCLHARNCHQVLGPDLNSPSDMLICWTPKGEVKGGTATAINLAIRWRISVYNLALESISLEDLDI